MLALHWQLLWHKTKTKHTKNWSQVGGSAFPPQLASHLQHHFLLCLIFLILSIRNAWETEAGGTGWSDPSAFIWFCAERQAESGSTSAPGGEAAVGFFKRKISGFVRGRRGVNLLFFQEGASGFQAVSWDNRSGKGPACSQVQEGQSGHQLSWLAPGVCCVRGGREFQWSRRLLSELGQLSHRQSRGLECGLTGSLAVWGVGNWPGPFNHEEGLLGHKAVLVLTF